MTPSSSKGAPAQRSGTSIAARSSRTGASRPGPTALLVPKKISSSIDMSFGRIPSDAGSVSSARSFEAGPNGLAQGSRTSGERNTVSYSERGSNIVARPVMLRDAPGHQPRAVFTTVVTKFEVGDKVVYPGHGVGQIESIEAKSIAGTEQQFFGITIIESGMKVLVPVAQAPAIGLRRVVDRKAVDEVYAILKRRDIRIDTQTWNRRFREYSLKLKTGSVFEIAEVMRDLSVLSSDKELSFGEKKMFDTAENLLVAEVAIVKARPADKIKAEFKALMG